MQTGQADDRGLGRLALAGGRTCRTLTPEEQPDQPRGDSAEPRQQSSLAPSSPCAGLADHSCGCRRSVGGAQRGSAGQAERLQASGGRGPLHPWPRTREPSATTRRHPDYVETPDCRATGSTYPPLSTPSLDVSLSYQCTSLQPALQLQGHALHWRRHRDGLTYTQRTEGGGGGG